MKIKQSPLKRSFAFNQTAYIAKKDYDKPWKLAHEFEHLHQQGKGFFRCIFWVLHYFASKEFRRKAETQAYKIEYKMNKSMDISWLYNTLINDYWKAYNPNQAVEAVKTITGEKETK